MATNEAKAAEKAAARKKLTVEYFEADRLKRPRQRRLEVSNRDPMYHYRLVRNNPEDISYRQEMGYEIDTTGEVKTSSKGQPDKRQIIAGQYVLMRRPKEIQEAHELALKKKAAKKRRGPIESFKGKARGMGVEVIDKTTEVVGGLEHGFVDDSDDED